MIVLIFVAKYSIEKVEVIMGVRIRNRQKFIRALFIIVIIVMVIGKWKDLFGKELQIKQPEKQVVSKEALGKNVLEGIPLSISRDGKVFLEENKLFKKYWIKLLDKEEYIDYEQNEAYIYIQLSDVQDYKLNSESFAEEDNNIFFTEVDRRNTMVIKKSYEYNNYVFLNELTDTLIVLVSKVENPYKYSAVLDPGHGGVDPGTEAYDKSFWEKDVTLKITKEIRPELIFNGCEAFLSREEDTTIRLEEIVQYSEEKKPDIFASIHINAYDKSSKYKGLSVYYSKKSTMSKESELLAGFIQKNIISTDGWNDREVKAEDFYVTRNSSVPAVLLECGFATNPDDVARLNNNKVLYNLSKNISKGIIEYLEAK